MWMGFRTFWDSTADPVANRPSRLHTNQKIRRTCQNEVIQIMLEIRDHVVADNDPLHHRSNRVKNEQGGTKAKGRTKSREN